MSRGHRTAGFTLLELTIALAIVGLLAAIAVPSMFRMQARARQSEAKVNLRGFFTAAKSNFAENGKFRCGFCGWALEKDYRYNYFVSADDILENGSDGCEASAAQLVEAGQTNVGPDSPGGFTAGAAGNIDNDTYCDGWNINDSSSLWSTQDDVTGG